MARTRSQITRRNIGPRAGIAPVTGGLGPFSFYKHPLPSREQIQRAPEAIAPELTSLLPGGRPAHVSPFLGLELASLLPLGGPLKALRPRAPLPKPRERTLGYTRERTDFIRSTEVEQTIGPDGKPFYYLKKATRPKTTLESREVTIPGYEALTGRAFEGILEWARPILSKTRISPVKTKPNKVEQLIAQNERTLKKLDAAYAGQPFLEIQFTKGAPRWIAGALNDATRLGYVYTNSSYIPVNLTQNFVLNVARQGIYAPYTLAKASAFRLTARPESKRALDALADRGIVESTLEQSLIFGTTPGKQIARVVGTATDVATRTSAALYELGKLGIKSKEQVEDFLKLAASGDNAARQTVTMVSRRVGKHAIDYTNMNPWERRWLSGLIFFYPWTRGATKYTAEFALEHPLQAAGLAAIGYGYFGKQKEDLGPSPDYLSGAAKVGETKEGLPIVSNLGRLTPFPTPIDIGRGAYRTIRGDFKPGGAQLAEFLTPAMQTALQTLSGVVPGRPGIEAPGIKEALTEQFGTLPTTAQHIKDITASETEREKTQRRSVYRRTKEQEVYQALGGPIAPAAISPEELKRRQTEKTGDYNKKVASLKRNLGLDKIPSEIRRGIVNSDLVSDRRKEVRKTLEDQFNVKSSNFTITQKAQVETRAVLDILAAQEPEIASELEGMYQEYQDNPRVLERLRGIAERALLIPLAERWTSRASRIELRRLETRAVAKG